MKQNQSFTAQEFAEEFINDLPELLKTFDLNQSRLHFSEANYIIDPNLNYLKSELNKVGYDIKLAKESSSPVKQHWQLIKL